MIKIEKTDIFGWEAAVRGMRNPKNSWSKIDSKWADTSCGEPSYDYKVGDNDMKLMGTLVKAGVSHRKFLRFIFVTFDITAPLYFWKEFKTYRQDKKFLDDEEEFIPQEYIEQYIETNSCSTMHTIMSKKFELDDFSHEHLNKASTEMMQEMIDMLNSYRIAWKSNGFVEDGSKKDLWWQIIQLLPTSYNQRRTVLLNYEVLRKMYKERKDHKLDEWHTFCRWIESLPYSELITE